MYELGYLQFYALQQQRDISLHAGNGRLRSFGRANAHVDAACEGQSSRTGGCASPRVCDSAYHANRLSLLSVAHIYCLARIMRTPHDRVLQSCCCAQALSQLCPSMLRSGNSVTSLSCPRAQSMFGLQGVVCENVEWAVACLECCI